MLFEVTFFRARNTSLWIIAALLLAVLVVFWNVPRADFVQWDDDINIYRNVHHGGLSWERIEWMFTDTRYVLYYAPLSWLTLSIIYEFSGLNPFGYHLASVLLHAANTVLVYFVIRAFLPRGYRAAMDEPKSQTNRLTPHPGPLPVEGRGRSTGPISIATGIGALLWAVHPLRVEPVAWATGISHLLAYFWVMISLLCYLKIPLAIECGRRRLFLFASVFAFLLASISYPVVMAFPAALVVIDLLVLRRFSDLPRGVFDRAAASVWVQKVPFMLISIAVLGFTLFRRTHATGLWLPPQSFEKFGVIARVAQASYVWGYYLWKTFVPFSLGPAYGSLMEMNPFDPRFVASFVVIAAITVFLLFKWRRLPGIAALWFCYLILLTPMLGLTEHPHYTSDRYSYGVAILFSILLSAGLIRIWERAPIRSLALLLSAIIAVSCGALSFKQTLVWQNSFTLFRQLLRKLDNKTLLAMAHWRLGNAYTQAGKFEDAERELREAMRILPWYVAQLDLARALVLEHRPAEAIKECDAVLATGYERPRSYSLKAAALMQQGKVAEAVKFYEATLRLTPNSPENLNALAWIRATNPDPKQRNAEQAVALASRACELTGFNEPATVVVLAAAYAESGEFDAAIRTATQSAELAASRRKTELVTLAQQLAARFRKREAFHESLPMPGD